LREKIKQNVLLFPWAMLQKVVDVGVVGSKGRYYTEYPRRQLHRRENLKSFAESDQTDQLNFK